MSNSAKKTREGEKTSSSENTSPVKKSSSSFKRRSTTSSQNPKDGKERNELKFIRVAKRTEDLDCHFRKTKTSIGDPKEVKSALVESGKTTSKTSNPEKLLDSIIQSRCLTKDRDRHPSGNLKDYRDFQPQDDYYDQKSTKDDRGSKINRNDSKVRKSVTSNKERNEEKLSARDKDPKNGANSKEEKAEDEIDKPWIAYLRNLRIPMMCQLHRKITFTISENALKATPPQSKKRDRSPVGAKRRNLNKNPN